MRTPLRSVVDELVPLAERLHYLQLVRLLLTAAFVAYTASVPDASTTTAHASASVIGAYMLVSTAGYLAWRLLKVRGITLFGLLLIADGFALSWMAWSTGGTNSPLRYLALVHMVVVALLASYRTAVKLALWHSMLAIAVLELGKAGVVAPPPDLLPGSTFEQLVAFLGLLWGATLTAGAFAAVNERELRRRKLDMEALAGLATALEHPTTTGEAAAVLHRELVASYGFNRVVVLLVDGDEVVVAAPGSGAKARFPLAHADEVLRSAWQGRRTQLTTQLPTAAAEALAPVLGTARNVLVTPLLTDGRAFGAVVAEHDARRGSRIERRVVAMVERFCDHAALALRNVALVEQLRAAASTDGLTGVANRRSFDEALNREVARTGRSEARVSLVMVDIDHFKSLNDRFGHQVGDDVLRQVAQHLATGCREVDVVARYGGEEFAIVLPDCPLESAVETAERLRLDLHALPIATSVTASFGVATAVPGLPAAMLVEAADAALYEAKRHGRDRVVARPSIDSLVG